MIFKELSIPKAEIFESGILDALVHTRILRELSGFLQLEVVFKWKDNQHYSMLVLQDIKTKEYYFTKDYVEITQVEQVYKVQKCWQSVYLDAEIQKKVALENLQLAHKHLKQVYDEIGVT